jgi:hypothetical protein
MVNTQAVNELLVYVLHITAFPIAYIIGSAIGLPIKRRIIRRWEKKT